MQVEVEDNPNYAGLAQFVFRELEKPRPVRGLRVLDRGDASVCDAVGVEKGGVWTQAYAVKVADSGAGYAFLVYGGEWGIRLRPEAYVREPWDLSNPHQWGEAFKLYGESEDLVYAD